MQVQFQRITDMEGQVSSSELVQEFEMSLARPMGIHIEGKRVRMMYDDE
jgi:hypothetical protein